MYILLCMDHSPLELGEHVLWYLSNYLTYIRRAMRRSFMRRIDASFKTNKVSTLLTCNSITTVLWVLLSSEASTRYARRRYYVWASSWHVVGCWFQSMEQISNQTIFHINALLEWKNILCLRQFHSNDQAIVSVNFARVLVKYSTVVS